MQNILRIMLVVYLALMVACSPAFRNSNKTPKWYKIDAVVGCDYFGFGNSVSVDTTTSIQLSETRALKSVKDQLFNTYNYIFTKTNEELGQSNDPVQLFERVTLLTKFIEAYIKIEKQTVIGSRFDIRVYTMAGMSLKEFQLKSKAILMDSDLREELNIDTASYQNLLRGIERLCCSGFEIEE